MIFLGGWSKLHALVSVDMSKTRLFIPFFPVAGIYVVWIQAICAILLVQMPLA